MDEIFNGKVSSGIVFVQIVQNRLNLSSLLNKRTWRSVKLKKNILLVIL